MRDYEVDVRCPLCRAQTRLNRLMAHAKKTHPDVSAADFKKALEQKINSDPSAVDLRRVTRSVNMVSATERVRDVRDQHHTATFSGGAIGGGRSARWGYNQSQASATKLTQAVDTRTGREFS